MHVAAVHIDDPRWSEFVDSHPDAGPFHLPAWASLIADCYRFEAFALTVQDGDGELLAGLPVIAVRSPRGGRRWVSLPFTDSCPPLLRADVAPDEVFAAIDEHVLAAPVRGLEVRAALPAERRPSPRAGRLHPHPGPPRRSRAAAPEQGAPELPQPGGAQRRARSRKVAPRKSSRRSTGCTRSRGDATACRSSRDASSTCSWIA